MYRRRGSFIVYPKTSDDLYFDRKSLDLSLYAGRGMSIQCIVCRDAHQIGAKFNPNISNPILFFFYFLQMHTLIKLKLKDQAETWHT